MKIRWKHTMLVSLALCLATTSIASAQGIVPDEHARFLGEVTGVDIERESFNLRTRAGDELTVFVVESTRFRSLSGEVQGLEDLEVGMKALVIGGFNAEGKLLARSVAVRAPGDFPGRMHVLGEVLSVDLVSASFDLRKRDGEVVTISVDEETRYRSLDGSLQGLTDLQPGMKAMAIVVEMDDGTLLARQVGAADPEDIPDGLRRYRGEIVQVVPGQGTFTLETLRGDELTFQTSERTRFEGRGMEIEDVHDLKKGMQAGVAAVPGEGEELEALGVLVWEEGEFFDRPHFDVYKAGRVVDLAGRSFTLQTLGGEEIRFQVDDETVYRSRGGDVDSFDDLELGMPALVGALEQEGGGLLARWVGVGRPGEGPPLDRPGPGPGSPAGPPAGAG